LAQYSIFWSDEAFDNVAFGFSADDLNIYFTFPVAGTYRPLIEGDSFSFSCIDEVCVAATLGKITANATGMEGISQVFIKLLLLILPVLTELFNYIPTSSTSLLVWKIASVVPISNVQSPTKKSDYRPISFCLSLQRLLKMLCTSRW
jgi:hypothetical protein